MKSRINGYWIGGILMGALGAICFSTKAIFVKLAYRDSQVDVLALLALRMLFSFPFFVVTAMISSGQKSNVKFTARQWVNIAVIGCLGYYISSGLDFLGLKFISAGIERLILFAYPTFVLIMNALWFKEKATARQWIAVGLTYFGLVVAFLSEARIQEGEDFYFGAAMILLCAVTFATYIVGSGRMIPVVGAAKFNSYAMSFACIGVLVHFFAASEDSLFGLPWIVYVYAFLMATLSTIIPSYLISSGINRIGANNIAVLASLGPLSTILQAYYILNEEVSLLQITGTIFILAGVLLIAWKAHNHPADVR
ncbi:MAG TPA: DMT family transporter [Cyclobacteriaceae bacterium]|nr:DMT family transporter [Cyclobacteriaceae bacterium]